MPIVILDQLSKAFVSRHMTLYETAPLIHSADERIDVRDLTYATRFFRDVATALLG